MSLAEQSLAGRDFTTVAAALAVYCYRCNVPIRKGEPALRYDGATYTHTTCPTIAHKTFAAHKYGSAR